LHFFLFCQLEYDEKEQELTLKKIAPLGVLGILGS